MQTQAIKLLLIEDNPGDVILTREAFLAARIANTFEVLHDGEEAMNFFEQATAETLPDIILLDLNLPKIDGRQVLEYLQKSVHTKTIPVVILTSSEVERDILNAYTNPQNHYLIKPIAKQQFLDVLTQLEGVWFQFVKPVD